MDALLDSIHLAVAAGASADDRRRGAAACRTLADLLESDGGAAAPVAAVVEVLADATEAPVPPPPPAVAPAARPLALGPNPFAGMSADQVLDLVIHRLRGAVGDGGSPAPVGDPFRLTLVPIPRIP